MSKLKCVLIAGLLIGSAVSLAQGEPTEARPPTTTGEVWQHHIEAWGNQDLDGIVSDYTEESLLIVNGKQFVGPAAIRQVFAQLFDIFDGGTNVIDPVVIENRIVYITWHYQPLGDRVFFGTDTFVVEDGKISVQTIGSELYDAYPISDWSDHP